MCARAAIASTECSPATCSRTERWISRSGSRSGCCAPSVALNCDWLPGRRRNSTRCRAIVSAVADYTEVRDVVSVAIHENRDVAMTLLFDRDANLEERVLKEQFLS